jgi:uncharacterized protein YecE (DUF72 family)
VRVRCGTSGYSYKEWKGSFYPEDLPAARMLAYYSERFATVEINNTFYRMPTAQLLTGWAAQVPPGMAFALKAPQRITHQKRLQDAAEPLVHFLEIAAVLGERLGPLLFQLPPNLKLDLPRLTDFLVLLPPTVRAAFEFRHASWHDDAVYAALQARGAALCIAESEELATPLVATAGFTYLRLRKSAYQDAELTAWAERVRAQPWGDAFIYFKHEDAGVGPKLAARMQALLSA